MNTVEPARITIPSEVAKIGIINRSLPAEANRTVDQIDKILSLEGRNLDKEGAESAVVGLFDELSQNERFETIRIIDSIAIQRKGLGVFPAALKWEAVNQICEEFDVDILFSLEFYDTDTTVDYEVGMVSVPNQLGIDVSLPGHKVTLNTVLKNGWRIYDPKNKRLLDEFVSKDHIVSVGQGINPVKAVEAVIGRKEAVLQNSSNLGNLYGLDVRPLRKRISRSYFVRGTDNFKVAQRRAQTNDWEGAADLWEKELGNKKEKVAGRACYNMAIISEINGNLETALEWASKSYSDYRNKDALRYVHILRNRMVEERLLNQQLSR
ncbi:DUF6340 family protein [Pricia sp. S334]|uniref:DUF6340 family protein n=1 Tax=Pricia mediterranea TaxID=3076079 RepID=A0ABU3L950_9FLAO|nr:DUF6340 family protein [Pricia sp. S334]MDT7830088.1 DUF6340 family protein [Pricia sp. S334]